MIEAIITGAVAIIVCMINNSWQQKRADKQHQVTMEATEKQHSTTLAIIEYKLEQLTHKVELHNNAVERLYEVERKLGIDEERIEVANHRIDDLEQFHK
ncbi:hypothetical protein [Anaerotignum sp.]